MADTQIFFPRLSCFLFSFVGWRWNEPLLELEGPVSKLSLYLMSLLLIWRAFSGLRPCREVLIKQLEKWTRLDLSSGPTQAHKIRARLISIVVTAKHTDDVTRLMEQVDFEAEIDKSEGRTLSKLFCFSNLIWIFGNFPWRGTETQVDELFKFDSNLNYEGQIRSITWLNHSWQTKQGEEWRIATMYFGKCIFLAL